MSAIGKNETSEPGGAVQTASSATEWNIRELLERLDEDQEFLHELLRTFQEESRVNLKNAEAALREGNLQTVMRAGHTMKGMLRNLSMNRAAEIAYDLETAAREENREQAEASLKKLEHAIAELLPEVNAQLAGVKA